MRVVIQRVLNAEVEIDEKVTNSIDQGFMILVGIESADEQKDIDWLCTKINSLRVFNDKFGKMNLSINEVQGDILLISQFTLYASIKKGNRPSFIKSAKPDIAIPLYENFVRTLDSMISGEVKTGVFGADMKISLINDGPVTIIIDSKNRE